MIMVFTKSVMAGNLKINSYFDGGIRKERTINSFASPVDHKRFKYRKNPMKKAIIIFKMILERDRFG